MDKNELKKWRAHLLDTGKRNNLVNFKNTKSSTVEVIHPEFDVLFSKLENGQTFHVKALDEVVSCSKDEYLEKFSLLKDKEMLLYHESGNPTNCITSIYKKNQTSIEETGVSVLHMAFGFIEWKDVNEENGIYYAPILLVPISISRNSLIEPFEVKILESDVILNPTFAFKMQNEYGVDLPEFESDDLTEYLEEISKILTPLGWTVKKECKIANFSFLKINMYKDLLENEEIILENDLVQNILKEKDYTFEETSVDDDFYNVVDADSSQLEAIEMAKKGQSFVLQGPPGTGKSQTITNIIAENLARGKKVLFVSEKLAALNVVYDKLKNAGLSEFCLELHSHKSNKKDVINELCNTLRIKKTTVSTNFKKQLYEKDQNEAILNEYVSMLHQVRDNINLSLYDLYNRASFYKDAKTFNFIIKDIKTKGEAYYDDIKRLLDAYSEYTFSVGLDYHDNTFYGYRDLNTSFQNKFNFKNELENARNYFEYLQFTNQNHFKQFGFEMEKEEDANLYFELFKILKTKNFITPALLKSKNLKQLISSLKELQNLATKVNSCRNKIEEKFDREVYEIDVKYFKILATSYANFFKRLFSKKYKEIASTIALASKKGKKLSYFENLLIMGSLKEHNDALSEFLELENELKDYLGSLYAGLKTDFNKMIEQVELVARLKNAKLSFGILENVSLDAFSKFKHDFKETYDALCKNQLYQESFNKMLIRFDKNEDDLTKNPLNVSLDKIIAMQDEFESLEEWCGFVRLLDDLKEKDLLCFVDETIENKIFYDKILNSYSKLFFEQWIDEVLNDEPKLLQLSRIHHDEVLRKFKENDLASLKINKALIKEMLSDERPDINMIASGSAVSILLHEGEKKRKQKTIRNLFKETKELVQTLKPCFLMSPLSVSTFLTPDFEFDVVIFDEASQVLPQDAICSIYRAKSLIVVGDKNQLPPSNFFNTVIESDQEEDSPADYESILDVCSSFLPQKRLKWHYRSKVEELIAFSNHNFYDNDLITFPSVNQKREGFGVDFIKVEGVYDRVSRTNRIEAEKIVELVFEHFTKYPNRSLGVVCFSISQQSLIDHLLWQKRKEDPSKETFFSPDNKEPFFVKNLETVQGDERDTIIFSVCYAKGNDGRLLMNFGPINNVGGERRLNVAFTRAKYNTVLVSSIEHFDIDLSRTSSKGVMVLRDYLDYAKNGNISLERSLSVNDENEFDSYFEKEVCEYLVSCGFFVDSQVGCSLFRIDLCVKEPNSSNYVLAIECDGESYHSSPSASDRDRLRQQVLESMGWKFYRIWSTDWFKHKKVEKERLKEAVLDALSHKNIQETIEIDDFEEEDITTFDFPTYETCDERKIAQKNRYQKYATIKEIVSLEGPISVELLLKRICFLFNKDKVTTVLRSEFNQVLRSPQNREIMLQDNMLYIVGSDVPTLRIPKNGEIREVKYIDKKELANGMYEVINNNVSLEKTDLYKFIAKKLGYFKLGDTITKHFDEALALLKDYITLDGNKIIKK